GATSVRGLGGKQSAPPALRRLIATIKREKPPQKTRKRLNGGVALNHGNSQATARREFREPKEGFL
ncbi:MAG TPA: hypothetical protein H9731_00340, partial [Candidatus Borkfalkia excrementipullorum]|nr:hypothetical protein [Candidatus Borkfalkia excrementipullorum]